MHDVEEAIRYGVVAYDWSNGRELWENAKPMNDEELLTKQAEMVLAVDPGLSGGQPRVWVYRETIQALNFFTSVREKLDDAQYEGWFYRFRDYNGSSSNSSYHVPACDREKCSGFYHAPEHTPQYPAGNAMQGSCTEQCDCGKQPCGQYVFDFRNKSFQDWFVDHYIINTATILHQPVAIGVGWLDDLMTMDGPSELDPNFLEDTGLTTAETKVYLRFSPLATKPNLHSPARNMVPTEGCVFLLFGTPGVEMGALARRVCILKAATGGPILQLVSVGG
jgi:hypothetical protein